MIIPARQLAIDPSHLLFSKLRSTKLLFRYKASAIATPPAGPSLFPSRFNSVNVLFRTSASPNLAPTEAKVPPSPSALFPASKKARWEFCARAAARSSPPRHPIRLLLILRRSSCRSLRSFRAIVDAAVSSRRLFSTLRLASDRFLRIEAVRVVPHSALRPLVPRSRKRRVWLRDNAEWMEVVL